MVLARAGTSGLHRSSQPANPVPRSSTKMGIPTPQQGRVCKGLVLFKTKKDYSFPFSYFQFFLKNLWFSPGISLTANQPYKKESLKESFHGFPTKYHPFEISFCDRATSQLQPYQSCQMKQRVTQKLTSLISTCVWCQFSFISTDFTVLFLLLKIGKVSLFLFMLCHFLVINIKQFDSFVIWS